MERRELEEIERFLAGVGVRSPLAYLGLADTAGDDEIEAALKKKRAWAQGQQANPKYRTEAMFVIKFNAALRRLLIDERALYQAHFVDGQQAHRVEELDQFIRGALAGGVLTAQVDAAIRVQGRQLDMADHVVEQRISALANELGATRSADTDVGGAAANIDFYELLQVSPRADDAAIETAYRERYRWARNLADLDRSGKVLSALDDAWRILRDPERRARYDQRRAELADVTEEVDRRAGELASLVGGEGTVRAAPAPRRPSNEAMLADIRSRTTVPPTALPPASPGAGSSKTPTPPAPTTPAPAAPLPEAPAEPAPAVLSLLGGGPAQHEVTAPLPNIKGRTLGLAAGPQVVRERQPRLVVAGKSIVRLKVPRRRTAVYTVVVQNGGQGRMPGKVVSDVAWLIPERAWLDPDAQEQQIRVEIHPSEMPANTATAALSLVADHGERRVVSFEVKRSSLVVPLLAAFFLALGALGAYAIVTTTAGAPSGAGGPVLRLRVNPAADRILIDDVEVARGATATLAAPEAGRPFRVRIETDGFEAHEELVNLRGTSLDREVRLALAGPVRWAPPPGIDPTPLPAAAAMPFTDQAKAIGACFTEGPARNVRLTFTLRATADGQVRGYEATGSGVEFVAASDCTSRLVRATRLAPFEGVWAELSVPIDLRVGQ